MNKIKPSQILKIIYQTLTDEQKKEINQKLFTQIKLQKLAANKKMTIPKK